MASSKRDLIPQARSSFVSGSSVKQIAASLGVSASTIHRWKSADEKRGHPWESRRAEHEQRDPRALLTRLDEKIWTCLDQKPFDADALYKLYKMKEVEEEKQGDPSARLIVMRGFVARYWQRETDSEKRAVVEEAVEAHLADLKTEAT